MSGVFGPTHRGRVRALYKAILRLHKGMPPELQEIGDKYVKEEFKRHKDAEAPFVVVFMKEWAVSGGFLSLVTVQQLYTVMIIDHYDYTIRPH